MYRATPDGRGVEMRGGAPAEIHQLPTQRKVPDGISDDDLMRALLLESACWEHGRRVSHRVRRKGRHGNML